MLSALLVCLHTLKSNEKGGTDPELRFCALLGFGYKFNSLTDENNELAVAFATIFNTARKFRVVTILQAWFPFLRKFVRP